MPWVIPAAMVASSVIGGAVGNAASADDRARALSSNQQAVQNWLDLNVPDPAQQRIILQKFVQTGQLQPGLEQAIKQGSTELGNIHTDPRLQEAQINALGQLQNEGMSGGLDVRDQAAMQNSINNTNAAAKGRNDAITSQFAQQGLGGSGLQLQAQMQNAQNATQNEGMSSLNAAGQSRQRALESIMGAGQLGGQMQQQQYNQQANTARAQDAINSFNARNLQNVNNQNVNAQNYAQQYNLQNQQNVSNMNTGLSNQEEMYNKGLYQQQYNNQLSKARGLSGQQENLGQQYQNNANATAGMWAGIGSGVSKGLGAMGGRSLYQQTPADDEEKNQ